MTRKKKGSSDTQTVSCKPQDNDKNPNNNSNNSKDKKFPGSPKRLGSRALKGRIGDLYSSPRMRGIYHHWLVVTNVNSNGEVTEVMDFDPQEMHGQSLSYFNLYFGHPTVPRVVQRGENLCFLHNGTDVMEGMALQEVGSTDEHEIQQIRRRVTELTDRTLTYRLLRANCEHLARYVRYGYAISCQVQVVVCSVLFLTTLFAAWILDRASSAIENVQRNLKVYLFLLLLLICVVLFLCLGL